MTEGFGVAAIPPIFVRRELEEGSLKRCDGPPLPPLTVTVTFARETPKAVWAVESIIREVVTAYCGRAGPEWATPLASGPVLPTLPE